MTKAIFAGSFDPPTYGHMNIIERASALFGSVDVVVAVNPNKRYLFSDGERLAMMREITAPFGNVTVNLCAQLVVDYAQEHGANILLRGIRNATDFSYEFDLAMMNRHLNRGIETLFIPTEQKYVLLKSSSIKELAQFGGDISGMVPPFVADALRKKFGG